MTSLRKTSGALAAGLTLAVALGTGVGSTFAYFTTYAQASGGHTLHLADQTQVTEEFAFTDWTKHVTISNDAATPDAPSRSVFVRARAYSSAAYALEYSGQDWNPNADGWFYYQLPLAPGETASVLDVRINDVPATGVEDGTQFNVVVVYECTPVLYDEDGNPYADWNVILDNDNLAEGGDAR